MADQCKVQSNNSAILNILQEAVHAEMTTMVHYTARSRYWKSRKVKRLARMYHKTAKYERHHFMQVSKRMALLGAEPEVAPSSTAGGLLGIELGLLDQFREDLAGECAIADVYTGFIQQCFQQQDFGTMSLFQELVQETEEHAHWIQSQLHIAEAMGESDYLQTWM